MLLVTGDQRQCHLVSSLFALVKFLPRCLKAFLGFHHTSFLTGNDKIIMRCRSHEWISMINTSFVFILLCHPAEVTAGLNGSL